MSGQKRIAIVGGGIVGLTTAYYLQQAGFKDITIFDEGTGQATKAAAGIISPWLSKRRNQRWYALAKLGASLYPNIAATAKLTTTAYRRNGTIITRANPERLADLTALATKRLATTPSMQAVTPMTKAAIQALLPSIELTSDGIFVAGGAQIDGATFLTQLANYLAIPIIKQTVTLTPTGQIVGQADFDHIVLATGAWLNNIITPLGLKADVRAQKGQLLVLQTPTYGTNAPVLMPEGEFDYIPLATGGVIIGASHEDDQGFDLNVDQAVVSELMTSGMKINPHIKASDIVKVKVGTRAYTSDYAPFFGILPTYPHISVASGLGSSGLTTGPAIGQQLAYLISKPNYDASTYTKAVSEYIYSL